MHAWVKEFAKKHAGKMKGNILEVGSYNVNGSIREVLPVTVGVDMREGPGVDAVCDAGDLVDKFGKESWDSVVSVEMLEHAEDWKGAIQNMWDVLKPGGAFLLTTRGPGFPLHDYPGDHWRFTTKEMKRIFPEGQVEPDTEAPGVGVFVVKNGTPPQMDQIIPEKPE